MQDLRYAFRSLLKSPGFTFVAVLILALGIGANVAMFNVVDRVLLRPLPYTDSSNLVSFVASDVKRGSVFEIFGVPDVTDLRMQTGLFEQVAAYQTATAVLVGEQSAQPVNARRVSPEFFTVFKVNPYLGRSVGPNDASGTVVLSNRFWLRQFGADRNILGRTMVVSIYSLLAVLLAVIGVYGVIAYAVSRRQSEIGVRMALGAQAGNIHYMVLRQGFTPCIVGLICGLVILLALVRSIESLLFEVSVTDPWTLAASVAFVAVAGFAACLIPARRAARIDPLVALRHE